MWRDTGFRARLILAGVGLQALAIASMVFVTSGLVERHLAEALQARVAELRPLMNAALAVPMAQRDYASVAAIVREVLLTQGVDYLRVRDTEGREVAAAGRAPGPASTGPARGHLAEGPVRVFDTTLLLSGQPLGEIKIALALDTVEATRVAVLHRTALIGTGLLIVSTLMLATLGHAITRPLRRLVQASAEVSAGRYEVAMATDRRDEIGLLMNAFDRMSGEVRRTVDELTESHALQQRYLEQARAERALAETQRESAQAANRAKSEFLANVSHEIRTPMNAILGYAALARERCVDPRQRSHLDKVESGTRTLLKILGDILDYAKIEAGRIDLEIAAFDPGALIADVAELFEALATARGLAVRLTLDDSVPARVLGDPLRIRQILMNLVSNAVTFTEHGSVELRARQDAAGPSGPTLVVEIEDSGIGMTEALLARVFTPFTQADGSITRRFGGTGLGLSIAHRLAVRMGGSLRARSQPGRGTTFTLSLPLTAARAAAAPRQAMRQPQPRFRRGRQRPRPAGRPPCR